MHDPAHRNYNRIKMLCNYVDIEGKTVLDVGTFGGRSIYRCAFAQGWQTSTKKQDKSPNLDVIMSARTVFVFPSRRSGTFAVPDIPRN